MKPINIYQTKQTLAEAAAKHFIAQAKQAIQKRGRFAVALSGGSTPLMMYPEILKQLDREDPVLLKDTYFFFGDERSVSPTHPDSNYRAAEEAFFSQPNIPKNNIHRIRGELDAEQAAAEYEAALNTFFNGAMPVFDLIFLGMGADGHTASLFPETPALKENEKWVVANYVEKLDANRITLTVPVINAARSVVFLVAGKDKATTLKQVLHGPSFPDLYPSQWVKPQPGALRWFLDQAAASEIIEDDLT